MTVWNFRLAFDWYRDAKRYGVTPTDAQKFCELLAIAPVDFDVTARATAGKRPATAKKWTPEALAELASYREKHGTTKTAKHFGISEARVRQLLPAQEKTPAKPTGMSVFTYRTK